MTISMQLLSPSGKADKHYTWWMRVTDSQRDQRTRSRHFSKFARKHDFIVAFI